MTTATVRRPHRLDRAALISRNMTLEEYRLGFMTDYNKWYDLQYFLGETLGKKTIKSDCHLRRMECIWPIAYINKSHDIPMGGPANVHTAARLKAPLV